MDIIEIAKALSDENRLRILNLLRSEKLCVGELQDILDMNQSNVSRHLAKLRHSAIITQHKKAQWVFYQINQSLLKRYPVIMEMFYRELDKITQCKKDMEKLRIYKQSNSSNVSDSTYNLPVNSLHNNDMTKSNQKSNPLAGKIRVF